MKRKSSSAGTSTAVPSTVLVALLLIGGLASAVPVPAQVIGPLCPIPIDPMPVPPSRRPLENFNFPGDYYWVHSGTHFQGQPAEEKWAWGFYTPPGVFNGYRTAVIVDNPFPGTNLVVDIEYRDTAGNLLSTTSGVTITPECFYYEQASPLAAGGGFGSIRVVSQNGVPFVGATVHHSYTISGLVDPEYLSPGLASMQQLQLIQDNATTLYAGPFPAVNLGGDPYAFNTGNLPTFQVINPNNAANVLNISMASPQLGGVFFNNVVNLPPMGSYIDLTLFNGLLPLYSPPSGGTNIDIVVTVTSQLPILGEQLMMDFFDQALTPLGRFRMGSAMMESTPSLVVLNPELTFQQTGPPVHTLMAIANVGTTNAGPVRIQYHPRTSGLPVLVDVIPNLPPGGVQRIAPGEPGIVNYPVGSWDWTVRILGCDRLIGWTMREVEPDSDALMPYFHKAYGETLDYTTGAEPGNGFTVATLGQNLVRKASPLERIASIFDSPPWWPGYNAIDNYSVSNIGNYWFRSFRGVGVPPTSCLETTNFAPQPFLGLPWSEASFTFKDGVATPLALPPFAVEHLGTVDHQVGSINGIDVIGDPLREWNLGFPQQPTPPDAEIRPIFGVDDP